MSSLDEAFKNLMQNKPDSAGGVSRAAVDEFMPSPDAGFPAKTMEDVEPIDIERARRVPKFAFRPVRERSQVAEEYRILRTRLQFTELYRNSILLTSCHHGEGKTSTAVNLAHFMAKRKNVKILILDFDIRKPRLSKLLGVRDRPDIMDAVQGNCEPEEALWYSEEANLYAMTSYKESGGGNERLDSPGMKTLMDRLHASFDFIVVDTCPCLSTADPMMVGQHCGGAAVVVRSRTTQRESVENAINQLKEANIPTLGMILTFVKYFIPSYLYRYQYYRSYSYYYYYHNDQDEKNVS